MDLSGLDPGRYLARLRRRNLIEHRRSVWPMYEAIERAHEFLQEQPAQSRIILLGNNVGTAFLRAGLPLGKLFEIVNYKDSYYILIPHPSGINRAYNDPMVRVMANSVINFAADTLEIGTKLL